MAFYYKPLSVFLYLFLLANVNLVSLTKATKKGGITVDLIHRDSALSPSYDPSITLFDRLNRAFQRSISRKSSMRLTSLKSTLGPLDTSEIEAPITPISGEYVMKIGIGTPPVDIVAIADTGSDLTWTQCKPCTDCYEQTAPLFDPKSTTTYRSVSCQSKQCSAVGSCDTSNSCQYQMSYGDSSYTIGDLAVETFTFDSPDSSQDAASFPRVVFGCGHQNAGTFNESASGIVGLGGGPLSIVNQLQNTIGGKFSYCLTTLDSNAPSKISFGSNALVTGPRVLSTPIVRKSPSTFYYLTLEGVSVGNKRIDYAAPLSNSKAIDEEGNIIIDSGTTLTFLPADLYTSLESALVKSIRGSRVSGSQGVFQLCYDTSSGAKLVAPPVIAHFKGADLVLPQENTFIEVQQGMSCLTLVPSQDLAIFGNLNQMNYLIGYDLENLTVNFLPTDCSKPL